MFDEKGKRKENMKATIDEKTKSGFVATKTAFLSRCKRIVDCRNSDHMIILSFLSGVYSGNNTKGDYSGEHLSNSCPIWI